MRKFIHAAGVSLAVGAITVFLCAYVYILTDASNCTQYRTVTGDKVVHTVLKGCMVQRGNRWVPLSEVMK